MKHETDRNKVKKINRTGEINKTVYTLYMIVYIIGSTESKGAYLKKKRKKKASKHKIHKPLEKVKDKKKTEATNIQYLAQKSPQYRSCVHKKDKERVISNIIMKLISNEYILSSWKVHNLSKLTQKMQKTRII